MRRGRSAPKGEVNGDDPGEMVVGTGVTMDFSAVDDPSLNVSIEGRSGWASNLPHKGNQ